MQRDGNDIGVSERLLRRFWSRIDTSQGEGACWPWTGGRTARGYGRFRMGGKSVAAHRFALVLSHGQIPPGLSVCHSCDNPPCCNPTHLWVGTAADNAADLNAKGRASRGSMHGRAKLTEGQVLDIRQEYSRGSVRQIDLAHRYNVNQVTISAILRGETWLTVPVAGQVAR